MPSPSLRAPNIEYHLFTVTLSVVLRSVMLSVVILNASILGVNVLIHAECHCYECSYSECPCIELSIRMPIVLIYDECRWSEFLC